MVSSPLIRPYVLGGASFGGTLGSMYFLFQRGHVDMFRMSFQELLTILSKQISSMP